MSEEKKEKILCEECGSENIKILNKKPAVFACIDCGDVWKCPEMEILEVKTID